MIRTPLAFASFVALGLAVAACGHSEPPPVADPGSAADDQPAPPPVPPNEMVNGDKMDEVTKDLDRKRESVSRCLAMAIDAKELPKQSKGQIVLELVITGGEARDVKVVNTTLDSQSLTDCVIKKVHEISFPQMTKPYETSYTYKFEAV